jgi:hypothetical protein
LSWSAFVFGSIATSITGSGNFIAGAGLLQSNRRRDVTRTDFRNLLTLVRVHLEQPADALAPILGRVVDVRPRAQYARVHAKERQLPDVRVRRDLECQRRERRLVGDRPLIAMLVVMRQMPLNRLDIDRCRQEIDDGIEQRLHALVLERRPAEHRDETAGDRRLADGDANLVGRQLLAAEILLHQRLVVCDRVLDHRVARRLHALLHVLRHVDDLELFAERLLVKDELLALDDVDVAGEQLARAHRQLDRICIAREPGADHLHAPVEVGANAVHLVREDHPRDAVAVGLAPDRLRLRLDAGDGVEQRHGAVEHAQ